MKFEEQFPSLIIVKMVADKSEYGLAGMLKEIKENCLDKQRVKEAIEKMESTGKYDRLGYYVVKLQYINELKKELGLGK